MRVLLLLATAWALAPISTPPKRTEFREGIGGATKEQAVAVGETVACAKQPIGPRDVVIRCYDISSDGKLLCGNDDATIQHERALKFLCPHREASAGALSGDVKKGALVPEAHVRRGRPRLGLRWQTAEPKSNVAVPCIYGRLTFISHRRDRAHL